MSRTHLYKQGLMSGFFIVLAACGRTPESGSNEWEVLPNNQFTQAQIRSDFEALYGGLKSAHANLYAHQEKQAYDVLYNETLASIDGPMSMEDVQTAFQKFAAFGNVGHARIEFPNEAYSAYRTNDGTSFPVYLRFKKGRPFVSENYSGLDIIEAGAELISINDIPADEFLLSLERHISADTRYMAQSLLEFTLPQYIWLEYGEHAGFTLVLKNIEGELLKVEVPARTRASIEQVRESATRGFTLSSHERVTKLFDGNIGYLRPGPFYDFETPDNPWNNEGFSRFIDDAFKSYIDADIENLIIDLRLNPGGDNSFSDLMITWFADKPFSFASEFIVRSSPQAMASNQDRLDTNPDSIHGVSGQYARLFEQTPFGKNFNFDIPEGQPREGEAYEGEIFVLIDRNSYSNAVNVASIIQDYGMGKIMGEKTSDMATTYGAMETFTLPETGISVGFPKAHIIRPNGDRKVDGVTPDILIEKPTVPTPNDFILEKALEIIRG